MLYSTSSIHTHGWQRLLSKVPPAHQEQQPFAHTLTHQWLCLWEQFGFSVLLKTPIRLSWDDRSTSPEPQLPHSFDRTLFVGSCYVELLLISFFRVISNKRAAGAVNSTGASSTSLLLYCPSRGTWGGGGGNIGGQK